MLKFAFLFTSYILLFTTTLYSQCNIPFEPNLVFEEDIPIICEGLDGFCSELPPAYTLLPLWGCDEAEFGIHNAHMLHFIAESQDLFFTIIPSNCTVLPEGTGIQAVVYEESNPYFGDVNPIQYECGEGFEVPLHFELLNLHVGKPYYLLIDGWIGNVCSYEIQVDVGSTVVNQNLTPPVLIEPEGICLNSSVNFSVQPTDACYFNWSVTGGTMNETNGSSVEVTVTDLDQFEVCVESTNFCAVSETVCSSVMEIAYMEVDSMVVDSFCNGDSYFINGMLYPAAGMYELIDTIECEIIRFDIELTTIEPSDSTIMETICAGSCLLFLGQDYCNAGEYEIKLQAQNGCDSTIYLNIEFLDVPESLTEDQICNGQSYEWNGNTYEVPGTYEETLVTVEGCDSLAILMLSLKENTQTFNVSICSNETYIFDGETYDSEVMVENVYTDSEGCDSIRILNLSIEQVWSTSVDFSICEGDTLFYSNSILTEAGNYQLIVETPGLCDSVTFLSLQVLDTILLEQDTSIIIGESYQGIPIFGDTVFTEVYESSYGCDSTVITHVFTITSMNLYEELAIDVFPNPFVDRLNIRIKDNALEFTDLKILNIHGQLVYEWNQAQLNRVLDLDLSNLARGSYLLVLRNDEISFRKRMIKL